jgi:hypothetical protein
MIVIDHIEMPDDSYRTRSSLDVEEVSEILAQYALSAILASNDDQV